jgi:hypothetical protein
MMRRMKIVPTLVMFALVLVLLPAAVAAATIKLSDYWVSRGVGDSWTYGYTQPPGVADFTVTITLETQLYVGKYHMGDYRNPDGTTYYNIVSFDSNFYYLYYDGKHNQFFDPAAQIPITQALDTVVDHPLKPATDAWYFKRLASLTVQGVTYYDVLLQVDLDKSFAPNPANTSLGLPGTVPYGVTHATWYARHVGELQDMNFYQTGLAGDTTVLKSTNAKPWGETNGAHMLLLIQ